MSFIPVHDLNDPELSVYRERAEVRLARIFEPEPGLFIAETPMVIDRALSAGYQPISVLGENRILEAEFPRFKDRLGDIPVYAADDETLREIAGYRLLRGMLCAMRRRKPEDPETICRGASRLVVLENVMNPTNTGAIFRSAAALGMDGILLTPGCTDPLYRRAIRVSVGNVFQVPWTFFSGRSTPEERIRFLRDRGYQTIAMALRNDALLLGTDRVIQKERLAVFMGTEGEGLCQQTIDACDTVVRIPMQNGVDSLNVAAASAVAFWELRK